MSRTKYISIERSTRLAILASRLNCFMEGDYTQSDYNVLCSFISRFEGFSLHELHSAVNSIKAR